MKQIKLTILLTLLTSMMSTRGFAHDIAVANEDGVTIYYRWNNKHTELYVSYRGEYYDSYSNEYTGNVVVPESVTYYGTTYSVTGIANRAFYHCSGLTSVSIPNSVTSIGSGAFSGCSGLTSVTIGNSVTCIDYLAFYYCSSLTSVTIPNSVTSIGGSAFEGCSGLTSVTIGNSVTSIGSSAFSGCSSLTSVSIPNSVTSIGYEAFYLTGIYNNSSDGLFYVDSWVCGYKGTMPPNTNISLTEGTRGIGGKAFWGCSGLTSVTIPNSVTSIGSEAFSGCSGLTSVSIPNSVTSIGSETFSGCSGLTSVTIPNSVTSIDLEAFCGCSGLTSVTIGNSVTSIDSYAFRNCSGLVEVNFNATNCTSMGYYDRSYFPVFQDCTSLTILNIGDNVQNIPDYAFYNCSSLTSVTIPNSVTSIGESAFRGTHLNSITIGSGVLSLGNYALGSPTKVIWLTNTPPSGYGNAAGTVNYVANNLYTQLNNKTEYPFLSSLFEVGGVKYVPVSPSDRTCDAIDCVYGDEAENVNIGETVSYKGIQMTVEKVQPYTCYQNKNIKSVELTFGGDLGKEAFRGCTGITQATVNNNGTIGESAFRDCTGITQATVNNNGTIGESAFRDCTGITQATVNNNGTIGESAFRDCTGMESLSIGDQVTSILNYAFSGCCIETATATIDNHGTIGNYSFQSSKMQHVTLGEKITSIGSSCFKGCSKLEGIVIPDAVITLGSSAFENCSQMTSVKLGTGVKTINTYTFAGCSSLVSMEIGSNVQSIDTYAFSGCTSLPDIRIPKAVTDINNSVFNQCSSLKTVIMEDREKVLNLGSNYGNPLFADCPLDSVYIGGNINYNKSSNSGYSPFYRNTSLRTVVITDRETEISENEFYGCTNLQNVKIGDGVESFGNWAFSGCSSLKNFSFGMSVETIGKEAFSDCTAMERIFSRSPQPPVCGSQALDDINKWSCVLTVPAGNVAAYMAADQWKEFFFIEEGDAVKFTLTYLVDGEVYKSLQVDYGAAITPEPAPEKEGYTFSGWSGIPETMPAHDVTVTGTFSISSYTLTYMIDGEVYKAVVYKYGATIIPEASPAKEGHTFSGWSEIPETMPAHDVTVTGTFSINSYTLTYMLDNEVYKTEDYTYGAEITPEPAPEKEGHPFSGWSSIPAKMPARMVTVWGAFVYYLKFVIDGEVVASFPMECGKSFYSVPGLYDDIQNIIQRPYIREGYTFSGWNGEIPYDGMPAHDVTISASFNIRSYMLTYMIDDEVYKQVTYEYGAAIEPEPQPEGDYKTFEWVDLPETMPAHDVVVHASYETSIADLMWQAKQGMIRIYSPEGKPLESLQKGLNIIKKSDGSVRKVFVK